MKNIGFSNNSWNKKKMKSIIQTSRYSNVKFAEIIKIEATQAITTKVVIILPNYLLQLFGFVEFSFEPFLSARALTHSRIFSTG